MSRSKQRALNLQLARECEGVSDAQEISRLLRAGADPNCVLWSGLSPLQIAASNGRCTPLAIFLRCGCDVNTKCRSGLSLLHLAARSGYPSACRLLVDNGATLSLLGPGGTNALHLACESGSIACVRYLLQYFNINSLSDYGWSPVHFAAFHAQPHIVRYLLENKADLSITDIFNDTALHIAARHCDACVEVILEFASRDVLAIRNSEGDLAIDVATEESKCVLAPKILELAIPMSPVERVGAGIGVLPTPRQPVD